MKLEVWVTIPGHRDYEVSNCGRVRSKNRIVTDKNGVKKNYRGRVLKPTKNSRGYLYVWVGTSPEPQTHAPVHQLVMESFVRQRGTGEYICHKNDNKLDNRLENLYFGSPSENILDQVKNNRHGQSTKDKCSRGHTLRKPNLRVDLLPHRGCLACSKSSNKWRMRSKRQGIVVKEEYIINTANELYETYRKDW